MSCGRQLVKCIREIRCGQPALACQLIHFSCSMGALGSGMGLDTHGNELGKRGAVHADAASGSQRPVCGSEPVGTGRALGEEPDVEELDDYSACAGARRGQGCA